MSVPESYETLTGRVTPAEAVAVGLPGLADFLVRRARQMFLDGTLGEYVDGVLAERIAAGPLSPEQVERWLDRTDPRRRAVAS